VSQRSIDACCGWHRERFAFARQPIRFQTPATVPQRTELAFCPFAPSMKIRNGCCAFFWAIRACEWDGAMETYPKRLRSPKKRRATLLRRHAVRNCIGIDTMERDRSPNWGTEPVKLRNVNITAFASTADLFGRPSPAVVFTGFTGCVRHHGRLRHTRELRFENRSARRRVLINFNLGSKAGRSLAHAKCGGWRARCGAFRTIGRPARADH
jgi:hypothetical protein